MATITNKYAGRCKRCTKFIPAGAGYASNDAGKWETFCAEHRPGPAAPSAPAGPVTIEIGMRGSELTWSPRGFLGRDVFAKYNAAVGVARYDAATKTRLSTVAQAAVIKPELEAAGFTVVAIASAAEALRAFAAKSGAMEKAAASRLDLPAASRLYPFQREDVKWLAVRTTGGLFSEMGTGKTPIALMAIPSDPGASAIVICPATLKLNWRKEAKAWRPDLTPVVLSGRDSFRWPQPGEIVIVNYDVLPGAVVMKKAVAPPNCPPNVTLIADEVQAVKTLDALRTARFRAISGAVRNNAGRVWILTGTPFLNRPQELWNILQAADLAKAAFGGFDAFKRLMGGEQGQYGIVWNGRIDPSVPDLLRRVSLRRMKKDVLDLPPKTIQIVPVELGKELTAKDRAVLDAALASWRELDIEAAMAESQKQKDTLPAFTKLSAARALLARAKIPALVAYIEQFEDTDTPVVVFSDHRAPVDALGAREGWAKITGDETMEARQHAVEEFQAGRLRGIALTITAGGTGLTLTRASDNVFVDRNWVPAANLQAEDRIHRIGATAEKITIHVLEADHAIDERINSALESKMRMIRATVDASTVAPGTRVETDVAAARRAAEIQVSPAFAAPIGAGRRPPPPDPEGRLPDGARPANAPPPPRSRRGPETANERWAARALAQLTDADPDGAHYVNGAGFNKMDGPFGKSLLAQIESTGLTDAQWNAAVKLSNKYKRQVGAPPDPLPKMTDEEKAQRAARRAERAAARANAPDESEVYRPLRERPLWETDPDRDGDRPDPDDLEGAPSGASGRKKYFEEYTSEEQQEIRARWEQEARAIDELHFPVDAVFAGKPVQVLGRNQDFTSYVHPFPQERWRDTQMLCLRGHGEKFVGFANALYVNGKPLVTPAPPRRPVQYPWEKSPLASPPPDLEGAEEFDLDDVAETELVSAPEFTGSGEPEPL